MAPPPSQSLMGWIVGQPSWLPFRVLSVTLALPRSQIAPQASLANSLLRWLRAPLRWAAFAVFAVLAFQTSDGAMSSRMRRHPELAERRVTSNEQPSFDTARKRARARALDKTDMRVLISIAMLSRSAEYAVRALSLLAIREGDDALHSAEIADELGLPPQFLTKILRRLTATDLVTSQRGRTGGFRLNRSADEISLLAVVRPFQDGLMGVECLLGQTNCSDSDACPLHDQLTGIRRSFHDLLAHTTLADIAQRAVRNGSPISISAQHRETEG